MMTCDNKECATNVKVERHEIVFRSNILSYAMPEPDLCEECASYLSRKIRELVSKMETLGYEDDD